ncbi:hypothetical protein [Dactylosporangium sp. CA-139066]|uniref:hypothetical protein n=1 Tax=Dactylosporangium sp. CA-139066 TaxID=3239930 RepID=UPI003D8D78A8
MPVALLPPVTTSGGNWYGQTALTTAPRYVRGRGNSRWHRVRSAIDNPASHGRGPWTTYNYWCGPFAQTSDDRGPLWLVDDLPPGEPVCGTCVGRALGAGQDDVPAGLPPLVFSPRWQAPPSTCPGSNRQNLVEPLDARLRVGRCLACGAHDSIRALGRGYSSYGWGLVKHAPGTDLIQPCPFHGWHRIVGKDGRAACDCGWPGGAP